VFTSHGHVGSAAQDTIGHELAITLATYRRVKHHLRLETDTAPFQALIKEGRVGQFEGVVGANVQVQSLRLTREEIAVKHPANAAIWLA